MKFVRPKRPSVAMEMGPLLDCVLLLLIFFMLSSSFLSPSMKIELPEASTSDPKTDPEQIVISLNADGECFVNRERATGGQLPGLLFERIAASTSKTVTIRGDRNVPYGEVVQVLDLARKAGALSILVAHQSGGAERNEP